MTDRLTVFRLPDLGEGLPDAEIREWYVYPGDSIEKDQPMVSMETAKAVVDIPAPYTGIVKTCHGQVGDLIQTGAPLVSFEGVETMSILGSAPELLAESSPSHTVVGQMEVGGRLMPEQTDGMRESRTPCSAIKASPAVRAEAKKREIDLSQVMGTGPEGAIVMADLEAAIQKGVIGLFPEDAGWKRLKGARRMMAKTMAESDRNVVRVTLTDDADISAWPKGTDLTVRVIQAIIAAVREEPALNAWYDGEAMAKKTFDTLHLGLAIDTEEGLLVPVIRSAETRSKEALRSEIDRLKAGVRLRSLAPEELKDSTITLSNFGVFAGKYADPVVVPPSVAILGVGRLYAERYLPLSLSFDHRAATGGEASRFLKAILQALSQAEQMP